VVAILELDDRASMFSASPGGSRFENFFKRNRGIGHEKSLEAGNSK